MSVQEDGTPPDRSSFDKATVDRWQVFGGMAGVAALLLSVVGGIQDQVPLSLIAAGVVTLVGVALLYRWGRRPRRQLAKHFVVPVVLTVVGASTAGVLGGLELRPVTGIAQPGATTTTTTAVSPAGDTAKQWRSGLVTLNYGYTIDLDSTGENGGVTAKPSQKTDLVYDSGLSAANIVTVAESGAETPPSYQDCTAATGLDDFIQQGEVLPGSAYCVKTTEGRWAGLVVVDGEHYSLVKFDLVVWEKQS